MSNKIAELKKKLAALKADPQADNRQKINALNALGWGLKETDPTQSSKLSKEALSLAETVAYKLGQARALRNLAYANQLTGRRQLAMQQAEKSLSLLKDINAPKEQADTLGLPDSAYWPLSDIPLSMEYDLKAIESYRQAGDYEGEATALNNMGVNYIALKLYDKAERAYQQALRIYRERNNKTDIAHTLNNLAMKRYHQGNYQEAKSCAQEGLQNAQESGNLLAQSYALDTLGSIYLAQKNYKDAAKAFQQCLTITQKKHFHYITQRALRNIAKIYFQQQEVERALSLANQSLELALKIEAGKEVVDCHRLLAEIYKKQGSFEKALEHYELFHAAEKDIFNEHADQRLKILEISYKIEAATREAEIYRLKNVELERQIIQRQKTEEKLRQSERELTRAHAIAKLGSFRHNLITDELLWSKELCLIAGLGNKERLMTRAEVDGVIHPEDLRLLKDTQKSLKEGGGKAGLIGRFLRPDGETRYFYDQFEVVFDEGGNPIEVFGVIQDITDYKQAEKELSASEAKFRNFIEQAFDGIVLVDEAGSIIEWNHSVEELTALKKEEALGETLWDIHYELLPQAKRMPAVYERRRANILQALQSGEAPWLNTVVEAAYSRADGAEQVVQQRMFPIKTDKGFQLGSILTDITKRKQAEREVQRQNQFLNSIIEAVDSPFYVVNTADYSIKTANSAARSLSVSLGENLTCHALAHKQDAPCKGLEHPCPLKTVVETKEAMVAEHIHFNEAGDPINVEVHGYPIFNNAGQVTQMVGYSIDITARRRAEDTLRKLSRAVEQSPSAIVITNPSGTIEFVNPAFTRVTGYAAAEAIGQNPRILKSGAHPPEFYKIMWNTLKRGDVWQGELINLKKNGELYWEEAIISPVKDKRGRTTHYLAIKENITKRKQTEAQLAENEARYRSLFEDSPISLWEEDFSEVKNYLNVLQEQGLNDLDAYLEERPEELKICAEKVRIIDVNQATLQMFSANNKETLLGSLKQIFGPGSLTPFKQQLLALLSGKTSFEQETINYTLSGEEINVALKLSLAPGYEKTWAKVLISILDITERKRAEAALQRAKEAAEKAQREAESANRAKTLFLTNINHELRTPLNAILGFTQLMSLSADLPPTHQQHLENINHSGQHLFSLINNVLDMSKIEAGQTVLHHKTFNLHRLLSGLKGMFSLQASQKDLELYFDYDPKLSQYIRADELKFRQILINLLGNALKFTEKGGVYLKASVMDKDSPGGRPVLSLPDGETEGPGDIEAKDLLVSPSFPSASPEQAFLLIEVQDTGPGIPLDQQEAIFEPFTQAESRQHSSGGTGLGLPISRRYAQLMGGDMTVISPPPTPFPAAGVKLEPGSLFLLHVPLEQVFQPDEEGAPEDIPESSDLAAAPGFAAPVEIDPARLTFLPQTWLSEFHFAVSTGDMALCLDLLKQIESKHPALVRSLAAMIDDFRFDELIRLIEQK